MVKNVWKENVNKYSKLTKLLWAYIIYKPEDGKIIIMDVF